MNLFSEIHLQWKTNRKLHMGFQFAPISVILNDLKGVTPDLDYKVTIFFSVQ